MVMSINVERLRNLVPFDQRGVRNTDGAIIGHHVALLAETNQRAILQWGAAPRHDLRMRRDANPSSLQSPHRRVEGRRRSVISFVGPLERSDFPRSRDIGDPQVGVAAFGFGTHLDLRLFSACVRLQAPTSEGSSPRSTTSSLGAPAPTAGPGGGASAGTSSSTAAACHSATLEGSTSSQSTDISS